MCNAEDTRKFRFVTAAAKQNETEIELYLSDDTADDGQPVVLLMAKLRGADDEDACCLGLFRNGCLELFENLDSFDADRMFGLVLDANGALKVKTTA